MNPVEKVQVKILKHVMQHSPGDVIEVTKAEAAVLCAEKTKNLGGGNTEKYQIAMSLSAFEDLKNAPVEVGGLTHDEMRALGLKNVVETPLEEKPFTPSFEEKKDPQEMKSGIKKK